MTTEQRSVVHPLRLEVRVNYCTPLWHMLWVEKDGVGYYMPLAEVPPRLRVGQLVRIEGTYIPEVGLAADAAKVTVLQDHAPVEPLDTKGRISDDDAFASRVVSIEAYVDSQQLIDDEHVRLWLVVNDRPVIAWIVPDDPSSIPKWQGQFIRAVGVYSSRFDPSGTDSTIELYVGRQSDVTVLEPFAEQPGFALPRTPIDQIPRIPVGREIRVHGRVQTQQPGHSMIVRDETGQITVESAQRQRLPFDAAVDVVGRTALAGPSWVLQSALYHWLTPQAESAASAPKSVSAIESIGQIRQLSADEASRGHPVSITGVVVWSLPDRDFFFLQDLSGGIRVKFPRGQMQAPLLLKYMTVEGATYNAGSVPGVNLRRYDDLGARSVPPVRSVNFEQAITGKEDGQLVEMRGYLQRIESEGDWRHIYVTTPEGEFVGHLLSPQNLVATPGSLIRVRGICETIANPKGQITGLCLLVTFLHDIAIDEDAPADPFALPTRPVGSLRQLSAMQDMLRVRVSGVVVQAVPGQFFYLQEDDDSLLVLSRSTGPLAPGDAVETVGILGREGARTVLREAVHRRRGTEPVPKPWALTDPGHLSTGLDARLIKVRGTLIDALSQAGRTRLTLQSGATIFEAVCDHPSDAIPWARLALGAELELTGICKLDFDDARQLRGFQLLFRSSQDIAVVHPAPFLTVRRALIAAVILGLCAGAVLLWVAVLRRQVRRQTEQIRRQLEQQGRLEAELERAQRLHSLGLLAGGIAHDFNNLLTSIMGNLALAMLDEQIMARAGASLDDAMTSSKRARDLTQQLLTFAQGGAPVRESLDLAAVVHEVSGLALSGAAQRADHRFPDDLWPVHGDRGQLGRALHNLFVHARAAMPSGGIISVEAVNETIGAPTARPLAPGRYVRLTIEDHGAAIPPEQLPGLFDPYAAAKFGSDRFALSITYSIVRRHGGHIDVRSEAGRGTTFLLWLPVADTPPASRTPPSDVPQTRPEDLVGARILVMDDEAAIRHLTERVLRRLKYVPTMVADGEECVQAYRAAQAAGTPFDLVILDLTVPGGMGGKDAIAALRAIDPAVRAIVSSGYSNDPVVARHREFGFQAVVPKPYEMSVLADAIQRVLAPRAATAEPKVTSA